MTEGKEMSPRRIYVLTLAIAVAAASAVCLYHGLRTGKDSVLGLTAQAEKYFGVESAELVLADLIAKGQPEDVYVLTLGAENTLTLNGEAIDF